MHFISYADSCSFTASYWKTGISFLDVLIQCLDPQSILASSVPRCECLGRHCVHLQVCAAGLRCRISGWIDLDIMLIILKKKRQGGKHWSPWILKHFPHFLMLFNHIQIMKNKATILVLELFGGKPEALSSRKTNMAMENEAIFQRFVEDGDFILKRDENCHPACRLLICQRLFPLIFTIHGSLLDDRGQVKALRDIKGMLIQLHPFGHINIATNLAFGVVFGWFLLEISKKNASLFSYSGSGIGNFAQIHNRLPLCWCPGTGNSETEISVPCRRGWS